MYPLKDPEKIGQVVYPSRLNGHEAKMLYDPGASHSFVDFEWAQRAGLRVQPVYRRTTLQHFSGTSDGAFKGLLHGQGI